MPKKNGFTLVELMVVAIIIGILATLGFMSFSSAMQKSRDARRKKDLRSLVDALQMYFDDYRSYPLANGWRGYIQGPLWDEDDCGPNPFPDAIKYYMDIIPTDPQSGQGKEYYYHKTSWKTYCLVSDLERTDDPDYISGSVSYIRDNYGGCEIQTHCGSMRTPHYVVTNP